jgi:hypothetical protein
MDKNQPYNNFDEQFNDLPLPGEEQSWQQMKKLLDDDDKNRRPVVPLFLKSCAGWGLALLIIGAATWFLLKPEKPGQQIDTGLQTETRPNQYPATEKKSSAPSVNGNPGQNSTEVVTQNGKKPGSETIIANPASTSSGTSVLVAKPSNPGNAVRKNGSGKFKSASTSPPVVKSNKQKNAKTKNNNAPAAAGALTLNNLARPDKNGDVPAPGINANQTNTDNALQKDSAKKTAKRTRDSVKKRTAPPDSTVINEKIEAEKNRLVVSAGIGLQQQIPLGGQKAVPYDYYGRTGSLSDYIPSVYLRVEQEEKWFVQGEFRYGAPQTLADFQYSRQTKVDAQNMTVTTFRLKKTYYHQLPLSFNYYVLPNFSIGIGGIYSRFHGAVSEKEVKKTDLQTQVETMSKEIVNLQHFNDSFLYKTQVHALFQTEYHWNRFDFGLRYTKDIQPFIKYTQPDGHIDVKKNQTFQFLVRFRVWDSKKKFNG